MVDALDRECECFCAYLSGFAASDYVRGKYRAAHELGLVESAGGASRFERRVVALAARGPRFARVLDAHARFFASSSLLRRKLVLVLAILESASPTADAVDAASTRSTARFLLRSAFLAAGAAIAAIAAALALVPVRLACAIDALAGE
jgi:hypothetical protein